MRIHRGSTEQNTFTLEDNLMNRVMSSPDIHLRVVNSKGREAVFTQAEVEKLWNDHGYILARNGHMVKVVRFPWHPLAS